MVGVMTRSDGDRVRLAPVMPPVTVLRHFLNMQLVDVHDDPAGVVLEFGPRGHMSRRRVFVEGVTAVRDITVDRPAWSKADDDQAQIDIGDDMYERERYADRDIDLHGGEDDHRTRRR
jgi:hypothetical protein